LVVLALWCIAAIGLLDGLGLANGAAARPVMGLAWLSQEQRAWLVCALVSLETSAWLHLLLDGNPDLPRVRTRR